MISEQTVLNKQVRNAVSDTWCAPVTRIRTADIRAAVYRFASTVSQWVRIPVLPYAALWEASLIAGQLSDETTFEPDPSSTETSLLTDSWLRG